MNAPTAYWKNTKSEEKVFVSTIFFVILQALSVMSPFVPLRQECWFRSSVG